eukprot:6243134-Alexandrium_andersonii.AAC.1
MQGSNPSYLHAQSPWPPRIDSKGSRAFQAVSTGFELFRATPSGLEQRRAVASGFKLFRVVSSVFEWFRAVSSGFKLLRIVPSGFELFRAVSSGFERSLSRGDATALPEADSAGRPGGAE